jgi:hypothetical protein
MTPVYKTDLGASKQAYCMINGKSIKFVGFQIGDGGCRNGQVLTVNRSDTILSNKIAEFDENNMTVEVVDGISIKITCSFQASEVASNTISNIGIIAQVVGENEPFLYCIGNFTQIPVGDISISVTINN